MGSMPTPGPLEILVILVIVAMFVAPIVVIVAVLRRGRGAASHGAVTADPALDALRTRFANGEIDQVEFERLRSVLQRR